MSHPDLKNMSVSELDELVRQAQELKAQKRETNKANLKAKIQELMDSEGFTLEELFPELVSAQSKPSTPTKAKDTKPRYRHPENPELTWVGRGKQPKWLQDFIKQGRNKEEFKIMD